MKISKRFEVKGPIPKGYSQQDIYEDVVAFSEEIEDLFGPATDEYEMGGVIFAYADVPCVFYLKDRPNVVCCYLAGEAIVDRDYARFQLAHEMVHCLCPSGGPAAKVFEEGAAAWYQQRFAATKLNNRVQLGSAKYIAARRLYMKLRKIDIDVIKKLRAVEPHMQKIDRQTFESARIRVPDDLLDNLLLSFDQFNVWKEDV